MINTSYFGSSITSQLSRDISNIRERIEKTSSEAVTGKAADPTAHLSGQSFNLISLISLHERSGE